jgi:hypothetical protein
LRYIACGINKLIKDIRALAKKFHIKILDSLIHKMIVNSRNEFVFLMEIYYGKNKIERSRLKIYTEKPIYNTIRFDLMRNIYYLKISGRDRKEAATTVCILQ